MRSSYPRNLTKASEQVINSVANRATMPSSQPGKGIAIERSPAKFLADVLGLDFLNSKTTPGGNATNWPANGDGLLNLARVEPGWFPLKRQWRSAPLLLRENSTPSPQLHYAVFWGQTQMKTTGQNPVEINTACLQSNGLKREPPGLPA
ncbi:hypothetical protein [Paraburkholderia dipogonis]|uniref:hypothetical protein n=1 Tax=Paraburkholderia dipogonis TaxID=1211383 RepID=UPI0038BB2560